MIDTMTMQDLGQAPGRARRAASVLCVHATHLPMRGWREQLVAPAFDGCGTTGVAAFPMHADLGTTTNPAGATGLTSIKRTARHLRSRST